VSKLGSIPGDIKAALNENLINSEVEKETKKYLDSLARHFIILRKNAMASKDTIEKRIGNEELIDLKNNFENKELNKLVKDEMTLDRTFETSEKIIQKYQPVFMMSGSKYGRAHFFAPFKLIGNKEIDTFLFNVLVLWFVILILYITLYYNLLQRIITYFENIRFAKSD
jgi:hypothetical protein